MSKKKPRVIYDPRAINNPTYKGPKVFKCPRCGRDLRWVSMVKFGGKVVVENRCPVHGTIVVPELEVYKS